MCGWKNTQEIAQKVAKIKCLRFYVRWIFIGFSTIPNFFICLIKPIYLLNKIALVDQILLRIFQGKVSKLKNWLRF